MNNIALNPDALVQMVVFEIQKKEYGIPVYVSREIIRMTSIVPVPNAPGFIAGVINLRGSIICVIDMRKHFGAENIEETEETRIIVVNMNNLPVGLIVDSVHEVVKVKRSSIDPVPEILRMQVKNNSVVGIAKFKERIISLLDLEKCLSLDELEMLSLHSS